VSFKLLRFVLSLMLFLALRVAPATAQNSSDAPQVPGLDQSRPPTPEEEDRMRRAKDLAKRENQERQAQLKRDTDHLLKLATELKQYVDNSNENVLSLDVVKKAEEIEKLAHSVKEKMKAN